MLLHHPYQQYSFHYIPGHTFPKVLPAFPMASTVQWGSKTVGAEQQEG